MDDWLAKTLADMQAADDERMAPMWAEMEASNAELAEATGEMQATRDAELAEILAWMEASNAELAEVLAELEASPERQEYLAMVAELAEQQAREYAAIAAEVDAMTPDWIG